MPAFRRPASPLRSAARRPRPVVVRRRAAAAVLGAAALFAAGCEPGPEWRRPLRLTDLAAARISEAVPVAAEVEVGTEAVTLPVSIAAADVVRLTVRAAGDAELVKLSWRLAGDRGFPPFRALTFPVVPDGEEHVYQVDLRREPYWTGTVAGLRLATEGGAVRIVDVAGGGGGGRTTSLGGVTLPSLPGVERLELALPEEVRGPGRFEARLGLLPRFRRPGVAARFQAWLEADGERRPVLDEALDGAAPEGWRPVAREVEVPAGARLVLSATATRDGRPLPEGAAVWGGPLVLPPAGRGAEAGPNVVLVIVDTLRADVLGSYGDGGGLTPSLDRLAEGSVRFADLSSAAPWTLPSIASMLTGFHPQVHGAGRRIGQFAPTGLGDAPATLPQVLAGHGFTTVGVYNNIYMNPAFGLSRGFDEYTWVERRDDQVVEAAIERLDALAGRRFFLLVHLFGPHHPYEPPDPPCRAVAGRFAPGYAGEVGCRSQRDDVPTLGGELPPAADRRWIEGLYRGEVAFTDQQVGRLLAALDRLELADDTVVAVVSDHGEAFFERLDQQAAAGYEQADHGHTHFQELVRVPGLLRAPGVAPRTVEHAVETVDLFPTLLSLAGVEPPLSQGRDLAPLLAGEPPERRTLLSDFLLYGSPRWSVRRGHWKLVVPAEAEGEAAPALAVELYDLAADPGETRNVAAERPEVVASLLEIGERERAVRRELRQRLLAGGDDVLQSSYLEWNHITKLRSLGYLQ